MKKSTSSQKEIMDFQIAILYPVMSICFDASSCNILPDGVHKDMTLIVSDRRKHAAIKNDSAQITRVAMQTLAHVLNKFSYVSGETYQHMKALEEQDRIPEPPDFILHYPQLLVTHKWITIQNWLNSLALSLCLYILAKIRIKRR